MDLDQLERLCGDAEDLADIRAVDLAWQEANELRERPIPWAEVADK